MQGRPLTNDFTVRARVRDLVRCDAGEMITRRVADAVAAGLDRMHLYAREVGKDIGDALELRPVVLDVLARTEMSVTAIVALGDRGEHAHLP